MANRTGSHQPFKVWQFSTLWLSTSSALAVGFALALLVAGLAVAGLLPHRITPFRAP